MRKAYQVLAYILVAEVVIQAMAAVYAVAGEGKYVSEGGVINKALVESREMVFPEVIGFAIHGINGGMIIPLLGLAFLVVSFFAKVPGGVKWAAIVFALVFVQMSLGMMSNSVPAMGALHGLNALLLFSAAIYAGRRAGSSATAAAANATRVGTGA